MKIRSIVLITCCMLAFAESIAQTMFRRTYGLGSVNEGKCVIETSDKGFAIAGSTTPFIGGQTDFYLLKTDSLGQAIFQNSYGSNGIDHATALIQMPDSGFLVCGFSNGYSLNSDYNVLLLRTDYNGNELWTKSLGTTEWDFIYDIKLSPDGNYIMAGNSYGSGNGLSSGFLLKIDSAGNLIWQKFIEQNRLVELKQLAIKNDGSFVVCGNISSTVSYPEDGFVCFLDANGDTLRTLMFDAGKHETINAVDYFSNGDLAVGGTSIDSSLNNNKDILIGRMDSSANILWMNITHQSGEDDYNDVFLFNDTLVIVGSTTTFGSGKWDFHILTYDQFGAFLSGNSYGKNENELCSRGLFTYDRGFAMVGSTNSLGPGQQSIFFVKSDYIFSFDPTVIVDVKNLSEAAGPNIFPNPTSGKIQIENNNGFHYYEATLYDFTGKIVSQFLLNENTTYIDLGRLNAGIYLLDLKGGFQSYRKKIFIR